MTQTLPAIGQEVPLALQPDARPLSEDPRDPRLASQATPLLTGDDWQQLHSMLTSPDASVREQGQALAQKLTPAQQQKFFDFQQMRNRGNRERTIDYAALAKQAGAVISAPPPTTGPPGSERTRPDTNIIGVNHEQLQQSIANWASTLDPKWQKSAAMLATFPADVLASLGEALSAPESIATGGVRPAMAAMDAAPSAAGRALAGTGRALESTGAALDRPARYVSAYEMLHDPTKAVLTFLAPKVAVRSGQLLQRAGAALRGETSLSAVEEAQLLQHGVSPTAIARMRAGGAPSVATASSATPTAVPSVSAADEARLLMQGASPSEVAAMRAGGATRIAPTADAAAALSTPKPSLLAAEVPEFQRLLKQGKSLQEVIDLIQAQRAFRIRMGLPSSADVRGAVTDRNVTGRWPE